MKKTEFKILLTQKSTGGLGYMTLQVLESDYDEGWEIGWITDSYILLKRIVKAEKVKKIK